MTNATEIIAVGTLATGETLSASINPDDMALSADQEQVISDALDTLALAMGHDTQDIIDPAASHAIAAACKRVDDWQNTSSADLAVAITASHVFTAENEGQFFDAVVREYATRTNNPDADAVAEELADMIFLPVLDHPEIMGFLRDALINRSRATMQRVKVLGLRLGARARGAEAPAALSQSVQGAIDAFSLSRLEMAAQELGIDAPATVTAADVDNAINR